MKVLCVGGGADQLAKQFWPEAEIFKTELRPSNQQKKMNFDAVVSYHVLNTVSLRDVEKAVESWVDCLKAGGQFQVYVPSLEWAAKQLCSENPSPAVMMHLFGLQRGPGEFFINGFTLKRLRDLMERHKVDVTHARVGTYTIGDEDCDMHLIMGVKR